MMLEEKAPAKINLCLRVGPRRRDGYHPVCSLMEKIDLFDVLKVSRSGEGVAVRGADIPLAENTVYRAVRALEAETGEQLPVEFELEKEIPVAAGLGGGSADAAAALRMVASLYGLKLPPGRLLKIAAGIGADVPFFMEPGPQLARGAGESLKTVVLGFDYALAVVAPGVPVAAGEVYRLYDEVCAPDTGAFQEESLKLLESLGGLDSARALAGILHNDLEPVAAKLSPEVTGIREELLSQGALGALVSGSGPAVFGIFSDEGGAEGAARALRGPRRRAWVARPWRSNLLN